MSVVLCRQIEFVVGVCAKGNEYVYDQILLPDQILFPWLQEPTSSIRYT